MRGLGMGGGLGKGFGKALGGGGLGKLVADLSRQRKAFEAAMKGRRPSDGRTGPACAVEAYAVEGNHRLRFQSRQSPDVRLCAGAPAAVAGDGRGAAWLHADGGRLRDRRRLVDARRALRLRGRCPRAAGGEQSQDLLQLVPARATRRATSGEALSIRQMMERDGAWTTASTASGSSSPASRRAAR